MSYPSSDPGNQPGFGPPPSGGGQYQSGGYQSGGGQYQSGGYQPGGTYPPPGQQQPPVPPTAYAGQPGGYGYPQQPAGAYPPGGQVPPGKPRGKGKAILFSLLGVAAVVVIGVVLRVVLPNLLGGGGVSPDVGECLNEPPSFSIVDCDSTDAVYQTVTVEKSPSGTDAVAVAADLGCGFREVLWEEREGSGQLLWVACADRLGAGAAPAVGDCLDAAGEVVACDDTAAVEEVTFTATEDLPRNADQATADALVERCPNPDTDLLYTSFESDGEAILWMVCTIPASGDGGGATAVGDLQAGDCLSDDPEFFVVVDCDDPSAVERVTAVHTDLTDTVDSSEEVDTLAGQLCDTDFYWAGWDQTPGTPVNWLLCVQTL